MPDTPPPSDYSERLERVLADYLHAVAAGAVPDRAALIEQHPDLAGDLTSFFQNRAALERLAAPLRNPLAAPTEGLGREQSSPAGVGATLRYFGDYELVEEIARGGMGVVFKARQISLDRLVAVKLILSGALAESTAVQRFQTEAQAAARLKHAHIVPIHEIGVHEGQHFFSMDYIAGRSLAELIREQPLPAQQAAAYVKTIAEAIQYAHDQGIVHRDLKPSNILIDGHNQPHVTDFGLAKPIAGDSGVTVTGQVLGTPSYMPPEQAAGSAVSPASDVYALGALLYALLTGRPPFKAATVAETLEQVRVNIPAPPRLLNPQVPQDLQTISLKCLEKDPARRYTSARALADDVGRYLAGEPITARPPRLGHLLSSFAYQNYKATYGVSTLLAASLAMVVVTLPALVLSTVPIIQQAESVYAAFPGLAVPGPFTIDFAGPMWAWIVGLELAVIAVCALAYMGYLFAPPRTVWADLTHGLVLVLSVCMLVFTGVSVLTAMVLSETITIQHDLTLLSTGAEPAAKVNPQDALLENYPGLRDVPADRRMRLLTSKVAADATLGVFSGVCQGSVQMLMIVGFFTFLIPMGTGFYIRHHAATDLHSVRLALEELFAPMMPILVIAIVLGRLALAPIAGHAILLSVLSALAGPLGYAWGWRWQAQLLVVASITYLLLPEWLPLLVTAVVAIACAGRWARTSPVVFIPGIIAMCLIVFLASAVLIQFLGEQVSDRFGAYVPWWDAVLTTACLATACVVARRSSHTTKDTKKSQITT